MCETITCTGCGVILNPNYVNFGFDPYFTVTNGKGERVATASCPVCRKILHRIENDT